MLAVKTMGRNLGILGWTIAVAFALRLITLGMYPIADTTEARYAEVARKMIELGDWITPWYTYSEPFWAKPPLSTWLTAVSMKILGVNEFAARLPHFAMALLIMWLVWDWMRNRSPREALYAVAILSGGALFFIASGAVMTDMALAVGMILAMRGFWLGMHGQLNERKAQAFKCFIGLGIGLLAKGPVALVLAGLPILGWMVLTGNLRITLRELPWVKGLVLMLLVSVPWYVLAELKTPGFLEYFFIGEHWKRFTVSGWAGDRYGNAHAFPRGTIWLFALGAFIPWPVILPLMAWGRRSANSSVWLAAQQRSWQVYLLLWALTPCLFFTMAGNIIWTYVLPGLPALSMLAAGWLACDPRTRWVELWLALGVAFTAVSGAGMMVQRHADVTWNTMQRLVAQYQTLRLSQDKLIFLGSMPYSASFYSQGQTLEAKDLAVLEDRLANLQQNAFVAVDAGQVPGLPDALRAKFRTYGPFAGYLLLEPLRQAAK